MNLNFHYTLFLFLFALISCEEATNGLETVSNNDPNWLIPVEEIRDGGPGKDGIPALVDPEFIYPSEASFLADDDLVIGIISDGVIKAYPHKILDWHEIINDKIGSKNIAITYCPLTGTGIGWDREINGNITTFGVSGLLYNSNLIPYDRATDSNWAQIGLQSVNGSLSGTEIVTHHLVETSWGTWKQFYPDTEVVSTNTGHSRNYNRYPYGDYRTSNSLIFSVNENDERLHKKERVHGIIVDGKVKAYTFTNTDNKVILDEFNGESVVIVGSIAQNFILSFKAKSIDGTPLDFSLPDSHSEANGFSEAKILQDQLGNTWDIFGKAVDGPNAGEQLIPTKSFIGYWFSWTPFYPETELYTP